MDRSSPRPGVIDPAAIAPWFALAPLLNRMWPSELVGLEKIPAHDRVIFIANHSAMGTAELWAISHAWYTRFGTSRPVAGMAHPGAFRVPPLRQLLHAVGAVEATREGAAHARRAGVPLLLFPGGDHEASRPIWEANRVDFNGRKGWIRLAREHGLTIVPVAITGSAITLPIIARGEWIAWLTGLRALGPKRAPLPALAPLAIASSLALTPAWPLAARVGLAWSSVWLTFMLAWVPSKIGVHFLEPIDAATVTERGDDAIYERVVGDLQRVLTTGASRIGASGIGAPSR